MSRKRVVLCSCVFLLAASMILSGCGRKPRPAPKTEPTITLLLEDSGQRVSLKMEEYLAGVVAAEVGADAPREALKAQAILARTFTVQRLEEKGGTRQLHGTDACTNPEHFQAYDASKVTEEVQKAIKDTRGQIITYEGKPALAWFHANSGGMTASPEEGLGFKDRAVPYLKPVQDAVSDEAVWRHSFSLAEITEAAKKLGVETTGIKTVALGKKGPSGRTLEIVLDGEPVSAPELRNHLGSKKMRSTLVHGLSVSGGEVTVEGKGWGHGVGMSQEGAKALAEQGKSAAEIISHYFSGVQIQKHWE